MSYAGNPNLAPDVQKRILETFRHTLDVAARGNPEEARLGCDFVLQLDPRFTPAHTLAERLRGASGPVSVGDLRTSGMQGDGAAAAKAAPAAPPADLSLEDAPPSAADLRKEVAALVAKRDFATLMSRAQAAQRTIAGDPELQRLLGQA
jgi:hypothetical protein